MNAESTPDLILHNGPITTLDPEYPEAKNVALTDGRVVGADDAEMAEHQRRQVDEARATLAKGLEFAGA